MIIPKSKDELARLIETEPRLVLFLQQIGARIASIFIL